MGCTSSREARRDRRWRSPAPYSRSQSMPVPNGCSSRKIIDSNRHVVALTSSTLGSLRVDSELGTLSDDEAMMKSTNDGNRTTSKQTINNAKTWSDMIDSRIPGTPCRARASEPETINTWELMEGLEEAETDAEAEAVASIVKPMWMQQIDPENSIVSDFDPDIISNFRKALNELSPLHQSLLRSSPEPPRNSIVSSPKFTGIVKARVNAFQQKIDAKKGKKCLPNGEKKVVFYFTSLRGIRKTYEDCWTVKVIMQGYGVKLDERDVSIHGEFKGELNEILGVGFGGSQLPRVFVNGKYLGGAEEVRAMHEAGELGKALEECEAVVIGKGGVCEGCGGVRFVPCETCSGSCKVFVEEEEEEEEEEEGVVVAGGFRRCPDCNENGLVRCSFCL